MIHILKSTTAVGSDNRMPLHEKLILIFKDRVKEADDDQDRARAQRDLEKLTSASEAAD